MKGKLRETGTCESHLNCSLFPFIHHQIPPSLSSAMSNDEESLWPGLHPIMDGLYHSVILTFAMQTQQKVFPFEGCVCATCIQRPLQLEQLLKEAKLNLFTLGFFLLVILGSLNV